MSTYYVLTILQQIILLIMHIIPLYRIQKDSELKKDIAAFLMYSTGIVIVGLSGPFIVQISYILEHPWLNTMIDLIRMAFIWLLSMRMVFLVCHTSKQMAILSVFLTEIIRTAAYAAVITLFHPQAHTAFLHGGESFAVAYGIPCGPFLLQIAGVFLLRRFFKRNALSGSSANMLIVISIFVHLYTRVLAEQYGFMSGAITEQITVLSGYIILPALILLIMVQMRDLSDSKEHEAAIVKTLELSREQLTALKDKDDSVMRAKHEIAQHLNVLKALLENGQIDSAQLYLQTTGVILEDVTEKQYSKNPYVNAVISYKAIHDPDITFDVISEIPEMCEGIDPVDLGILIMNLIDQRLAIIRRNDLTPRIELHMTQREQMLCIRIDSETAADPFSDDLTEQIGNSVTEKIITKYSGQIYKGVNTATDSAILFKTGDHSCVYRTIDSQDM